MPYIILIFIIPCHHILSVAAPTTSAIKYATNGPTNGTILNGSKLVPNQEIQLTNGSVITMGDEDFIYNA